MYYVYLGTTQGITNYNIWEFRIGHVASVVLQLIEYQVSNEKISFSQIINDFRQRIFWRIN